MLLELPRLSVEAKFLHTIKPIYIPYPINRYGCGEELTSLSTLKVVGDEVQDLLQRYAVVIPHVVRSFRSTGYTYYQCMVYDDEMNVTRGLLEKLGYKLEECEFSPYKLYWMTLRTKVADKE